MGIVYRQLYCLVRIWLNERTNTEPFKGYPRKVGVNLRKMKIILHPGYKFGTFSRFAKIVFLCSRTIYCVEFLSSLPKTVSVQITLSTWKAKKKDKDTI